MGNITIDFREVREKENLSITHNRKEGTLKTYWLDNEAVLAYRLFMNGETAAIDFTSTYVPPECRGKGLAEKLVRAGLQWAKAQNYELHASCWYVAKFIR